MIKALWLCKKKKKGLNYWRLNPVDKAVWCVGRKVGAERCNIFHLAKHESCWSWRWTPEGVFILFSLLLCMFGIFLNKKLKNMLKKWHEHLSTTLLNCKMAQNFKNSFGKRKKKEWRNASGKKNTFIDPFHKYLPNTYNVLDTVWSTSGRDMYRVQALQWQGTNKQDARRK